MFLTRDSKSPYFQLVYFVNGKRTKISTKTSDRKEAEKFKASFIPKHKLDSIPQKVSIKLSSFITEYKSYVKNTFSEKYLNKAVTPSFNRLQAYLPDTHLEYISSKDVDQFISSVYAKSKFAASLYHRTLKAAFNKAVIWNYIQENPFRNIKSPKIVKSFPVYLSEAELILILNKTEDQLLKDIFITAFYTGMRLDELLSMNWSWVDFSSNLITVKNSNGYSTKSKKERIIPIHQKVKEVLIHRYSTNGKSNLVFYRTASIKLNGDFISKQFKKAVRAAKLNDSIHFHSLRHSFASNLVQHGVNLYVVKELSGHEDIKTTQVYSHLTQSSLSNAVCLL